MTLGFDKRFSIAGRSRLLAGAALCEGAGTSPDFALKGGLDEHCIICVDMDAFFASVEQQCASGALDGKPVMVCGNTERRSAVAAANYLAREYGVRAGTPITTARRLCPHGIFIEGDCAGVLHAYDLRTGPGDPPEIWRVPLGSCIEATPAVWKGRIYVGTRGGFECALADG